MTAIIAQTKTVYEQNQEKMKNIKKLTNVNYIQRTLDIAAMFFYYYAIFHAQLALTFEYYNS